MFDFVSRTTPTGGDEFDYLTYLFKIFGMQLTANERAAAAPHRKSPARSLRGLSFSASVRAQCASTASSSSATMLVILIIGFTAGPAVSL